MLADWFQKRVRKKCTLEFKLFGRMSCSKSENIPSARIGNCSWSSIKHKSVHSNHLNCWIAGFSNQQHSISRCSFYLLSVLNKKPSHSNPYRRYQSRDLMQLCIVFYFHWKPWKNPFPPSVQCCTICWLAHLVAHVGKACVAPKEVKEEAQWRSSHHFRSTIRQQQSSPLGLILQYRLLPRVSLTCGPLSEPRRLPSYYVYNHPDATEPERQAVPCAHLNMVHMEPISLHIHFLNLDLTKNILQYVSRTNKSEHVMMKLQTEVKVWSYNPFQQCRFINKRYIWVWCNSCEWLGWTVNLSSPLLINVYAEEWKTSAYSREV